MPQPLMLKELKLNGSMKTYKTRPSRTNTQKRCPFHYGDWNAKVGSQETPGVTGKFGPGVWNEAGQRLIEFCQENELVIMQESFPRQVDKESRGPQRRERSGILKEEERTNFFSFSTFLRII